MKVAWHSPGPDWRCKYAGNTPAVHLPRWVDSYPSNPPLPSPPFLPSLLLLLLPSHPPLSPSSHVFGWFVNTGAKKPRIAVFICDQGSVFTQGKY